MSNAFLLEIVKKQKKGIPTGVYSVCSAHPYVIDATLEQALEDGSHVLIETTANQVNQFGGYTGMKPEDFRNYIDRAAAKIVIAKDCLILGGDHLGPYPWRAESTHYAIKKGCELVRQYVKAGFTKIHLDASMKLGDDSGWHGEALCPEIVAERTALLCLAAEEAFMDMMKKDPKATPPVYVIGTEVPTPGGTLGDSCASKQTSVDELKNTVELTEKCFKKHGLDRAWKRVIAVVIQTGAEFGDQKVDDYNPKDMQAVSTAIHLYENLVLEAHSTDYQKMASLRQMVQDGIAILKVGPALTFAMREAIFLLCHIEDELIADNASYKPSHVKSILERNMLASPEKWEAYYKDDEKTLKINRKYSYSDRSRYYWADRELKAATALLIKNLREYQIPLTLVSQYFNDQYWKIRECRLYNDPEALIKERIKAVLRAYLYAINIKEDRTHGASM